MTAAQGDGNPTGTMEVDEDLSHLMDVDESDDDDDDDDQSDSKC